MTVPDGYEVRLHKIGSSEDIFPDGLSTKDIKDLNNTLVVDLSTPGTIDLKGTLLSNGQPLLTMDGVDTEIDKKITALNLSGTYATKAALTTVETTANERLLLSPQLIPRLNAIINMLPNLLPTQKLNVMVNLLC